MQSRLKKSLYLGLAALSLSAAALVPATSASAKSYATAGAYQSLTSVDATKRNVELTGANAIYTKPGTVKGAKTVANKAEVAKLAASKSSNDYFRVYGMKKTNRGSIYYRVVSMAGKYRGYIYGGNTADTFQGGLKSAETMTKAALPTRTTGYMIKDVNKNTIWDAPKYSQYGAKKATLYGAAKNSPFTVDGAATKTREGWLYYHVVNADKSVSGWIFAGKGYDANVTDNTKQDLGGLTLTVADAAATADNSVKIVYRDSTGATISSATWVTTTKDTHANGEVNLTDKAADGQTPAVKADRNAAGVKLNDFLTANKPAGYLVSSPADATGAKYGQTIYATVAKSSMTTVKLVADSVSNVLATKAADSAVVLNGGGLKSGQQLTNADFLAPITPDAKKALTGNTGDLMKDAQNSPLATIKTGLAANKVEGLKTYTDANGDNYHYQFTFTDTNFDSDNRGVNFGGILTASYTAQLVTGKGAAASTTTDNSWLA